MSRNLNFYITTTDEQFLQSNFLNFRFLSLISIPDIIEELGTTYETMEDYNALIINKTVRSKIENVFKRKKYYSILYVNPWINYESIKNITEEYGENENISKICLLDKQTDPDNIDLWQYFEEVTFFPEVRKRKISDCDTNNL